MSETGETKRRFQFSLRKLLLWTTVVAALLAVLRMMGLGVTGVSIAVSGVVIPGVLRFLFGFPQALILWTGVSAVAGVVVAFATMWELHNAGPNSIEITVLNVMSLSFLGFVLGAAAGGETYLLTDAACRFLDWLDRAIDSGDAR